MSWAGVRRKIVEDFSSHSVRVDVVSTSAMNESINSFVFAGAGLGDHPEGVSAYSPAASKNEGPAPRMCVRAFSLFTAHLTGRWPMAPKSASGCVLAIGERCLRAVKSQGEPQAGNAYQGSGHPVQPDRDRRGESHAFQTISGNDDNC